MSSTKYVLHYWNAASRGELIRIAFHQAGVEFEDKRYEFSEFEAMKKNHKLFPLGQMPVLAIDDQIVCQSHAITRYLAREFNLYGKTNKDHVTVDQVLDTFINVEEKLWGSYFRSKTVEEKATKIKEFFSDYAPRAFKMLEGILEQNNSGKDYIVGKEITIADIHVMVAIETIQLDHNLEEFKTFIDSYLLIKSLNERVRNSEKIKNYLDKRGLPFYPFPKKE